MLVKAALFLALFALGNAQSATCPPLDSTYLWHRKPISCGYGIRYQWMITVDNFGCRQISQDCSGYAICKNKGEVLWQCSTCEPTCMNTNIKSSCGNGCGPPRCQCAPGLVRDILSGKCIPPAKCRTTAQQPPHCQVGEVLVRQNCSKLTCERQCEGPPNCNQRCNQLLCICADGFFKASDGKCVSANQCLPRLEKADMTN